jgi:hypothetical protein
MFCALVLVVGCLPLLIGEVRHLLEFGHLGVGPHVDVIRQEAYIGIPGVNGMYGLLLSNLTPVPLQLRGCAVPTDLGPETMYRFQVERWNSESSEWEEIVAIGPNACDGFEIVSRAVWPGMSCQVVGWEATAARTAFEKGDLARFKLYGKFHYDESDSRQFVVPSEGFTIDEQPSDPRVQRRIRH